MCVLKKCNLRIIEKIIFVLYVTLIIVLIFSKINSKAWTIKQSYNFSQLSLFLIELKIVTKIRNYASSRIRKDPQKIAERHFYEERAWISLGWWRNARHGNVCNHRRDRCAPNNARAQGPSPLFLL